MPGCASSKSYACALAAAALACLAPAAVEAADGAKLIRVGPEREVRLPSHAAGLARDGDTIEIDAGTYRDCAVWRASGITIRGVGGIAHVKDVVCEEKAIWVVYGGVTTIENVRFSGARVRDRNGAGIRHQGNTLLVRNGHFHNNQMGILTQDKRSGILIVVDSRFERNGDCPTFCGHGIYAGFSNRLRVLNSTFVGHSFGHHVKSRAEISEIVGNRFSDGPGGTASFSIDLPNGGTALIRDNRFEKGPSSNNRTAMIAIGNEGLRNRSRGIAVERNVFESHNPRLQAFVWSRGLPVRMDENTFQGEARHLRVSARK